tara:strand:- start:100 stop:414 length:315 start_codon:yes stop_codon:yes gene_type:complete
MYSNKLLKILLVFTVLFNIIDLVVSICIIFYGPVDEANPVMEMYLELGILPFIMAKVVLVGGGCVILWKHKEKSLARAGIYIVFSYYLVLIGYFAYGLTTCYFS